MNDELLNRVGDNGHSTLEYPDPILKEDMLATFRKTPVAGHDDFDVILVDVNMPGIDGVEFIKVLKTLKEQHSPVIAIMTGSASNHQEQMARDLKPTFMYRKPFNVLDLMDEICRHIKH